MDSFSHRAAAADLPDQESASKMTEAPAPARQAGWKLESVTVRATENGGFIVTCSHRRERPSEKSSYEDTYQSKDYAFWSLPDAMGYVEQALSGPTTGGNGNMTSPTPR